MTKEIDKLVKLFGGQKHLAKAMGVSNNAVSKWVIKGALPPGRVTQAIRLVHQYKRNEEVNISLEALLTESSQMIGSSNKNHTTKNTKALGQPITPNIRNKT